MWNLTQKTFNKFVLNSRYLLWKKTAMNFAFWHQFVKMLPYSGKLSRVRISRFCGYSVKFVGVTFFVALLHKSSPRKSFFQSISEVFSHESFLLFDILKKLPTKLPLNTGTVQPDLFSVSHDHAELLIE